MSKEAFLEKSAKAKKDLANTIERIQNIGSKDEMISDSRGGSTTKRQNLATQADEKQQYTNYTGAHSPIGGLDFESRSFQYRNADSQLQ